ncbi:MAG: hypothetical protein JWL63_899 [Rhodocyclales bacterium]|nr:hypothetical protein [Rhodocyclales bacterium]
MLSVSERAQEAQYLSKNAPAADKPQTYELVRRAFNEVVFIDSSSTRFKGVPSVFAMGILANAYFPGAWLHMVTPEILGLLREADLSDALLLLVSCVVALAMLFVIGSACVRTFRIDLFGPKEVPLVFNRKTRKVYKFIENMPARDLGSPARMFKYWLTAFQPWPMTLIEYDWDCLEAEYFEQTTLMGNVVKTFHILQFYVKESPNSNTVIGSFTIASPLTLSREIAMDLWEFIRRYMEENGPVMYPGDKPAPAHPQNLWQAANTVWVGWPLVVGAAIWAANRAAEAPDWYSLDGPTFVTALLSWPFTLAIIFNWLAHKWGKNITLPSEIMVEAGEPLDLRRLADQANGIAAPAEPASRKYPSRIGAMRKSRKHR